MSNQRRRDFLSALAASAGTFNFLPAWGQESSNTDTLSRDRCEGLLWGTLLGDAMGGPLEFAEESIRAEYVIGCRDWPESRRLDHTLIHSIAQRATLMSYKTVRPDTAPYGPWASKAPAGTLTDDSRLKIVLIRAIRGAARRDDKMVAKHDLAQSILDFSPRVDAPADAETQKLVDEGMREYRYAANWLLGKRDPGIALPLDRLWAGVANCSGQMMLLPLALDNAGQPDKAYRMSFELNFIDSPAAKDIASAIIAGLASAIGDDASQAVPKRRWETFENAMRTIDPFRFEDVPFVGRPLIKWMDLVDSIVARADGRPSVAYRLLETEGKPIYFWDAHFTLIVAFTLLKICKYNGLAALALAIDFGHDTDSYAQLIGAMVGAVEGTEVFPVRMRETIAERLMHDYGENVSEWTALLTKTSNTNA